MVRIILGVLAAIVLVIVGLAIVHAVASLLLWIAIIAVVAFGLFRLGKFSGRRSRQRRY